MFARKPKPPSNTPRRRPTDADTGTRRNQAFSYYAKRSYSSDNTGRGMERENPKRTIAGGWLRRLARQRMVLWLVSLGLLATAIVSLQLSSEPRVTVAHHEGSSIFLRSQEAYTATARETLGRSPLNRNKITVDTDALTRDLKRTYPEIRDVQVRLPLFGGRIHVHLEPNTPTLLLTSGTNAYILDQTGQALLSASQAPGDISRLKVPTVADQSSLAIQTSKRALPSSTVTFVRDVTAMLQAARVQYSSLVLPPAASQLDVYIKGTPYYVKFNMQHDARDQTGAFLAAKKRLESQGAVPGQYMDVRVPERVYYK